MEIPVSLQRKEENIQQQQNPQIILYLFPLLSRLRLNSLTKTEIEGKKRTTYLALLNTALNWLFFSGAKSHKLNDLEIMSHLDRM